MGDTEVEERAPNIPSRKINVCDCLKGGRDTDDCLEAST
jgi:hypothetical protein